MPRQSGTWPPGWAIWPGVSCCSATATRSLRVSRRPLASSESLIASSANTSKSLLVSHGGSIAGVNACTKGCMSVELRSCFSYQVAAGSTMSLSSVELVMRKSAVMSRSSFPSGASSCHFTTSGRRSAPWPFSITLLCVPRRCLRKYSLPLAEEPNRFERHRIMVRGQFSGASMSSTALFNSPDLSLAAT